MYVFIPSIQRIARPAELTGRPRVGIRLATSALSIPWRRYGSIRLGGGWRPVGGPGMVPWEPVHVEQAEGSFPGGAPWVSYATA
jgi:hypothetical protein